MADTVSTQVLSDTSGVKYVAKLTNISDGSGESLVNKIDSSASTFMTEDANRKIAKITLEFLAKKSWSSLSTEIIKKKSTLNSFNRIIDDNDKKLADSL